MANVLSTLYPPLMDTFMPAFPYTDNVAKVHFSVSPYNDASNIRKLHISIVDQRTNKSVIVSKYSEYHFGDYISYTSNDLWIVPFTSAGEKGLVECENKEEGKYVLFIPTDILRSESEQWIPDNYYKVQIRFDESEESVAGSYLLSQRSYFSEWSSVCLLRTIPEITLSLRDLDSTNKKVRTVQLGSVPFAGQLSFSPSTTQEKLESYIFTLKDKDTSQIVLTSGRIYASNFTEQNYLYWLADISTSLEANKEYKIEVTYRTKNQYEATNDEFILKTSGYDSTNFNPTWDFHAISIAEHAPSNASGKSIIATREDGEVHITITISGLPAGYLYVKRASSLDNFKTWELIDCSRQNGDFAQDIIDSTVGSLIGYKYCCQYRIKRSSVWTKVSKPTDSLGREIVVYPDFDDILLYRQSKQLAIRLNSNITSYSAVVNRQVINTLGGKYPKFAENANMNYKKFSITGIISAEADYNRKFLNEFADNNLLGLNLYDKNIDSSQYTVRNDTLADGDQPYNKRADWLGSYYPETATQTSQLALTTDHDLYPKDNIWWERVFREEALKWLNDGEPKLFRSMTEGNMVVMLTDISLTPNQQLSRRVYSFNATAYEIGDGYNYESLASFGIIDIKNDYYDDLISGVIDQDAQKDKENTYQTVETLGQLYQKSAVNKGLFTGTLDRTQLGDHSKVDNYTIQDWLEYFLYDGALKNKKVVDSSYELRDVRIHFESLPQWYYQKKDDSWQLVDVDPEKGETGKETKWYHPYNKDLSINDYNTDNKRDAKIQYFLGYKIQLNIIESKTGTSQPVTIMVNEKGYYQIPSNLIVSDIQLFDGAVATIDYKLKYKTQYDESSVPTKPPSVNDNIVGQISGKWEVGEEISSQIKQKYEVYELSENDGYEDPDVPDGMRVVEKQELEEITGFGYDGTSYATIGIQFAGEDYPTDYVVGRTGVYNLMKDFPIENVYFKGRRMFRHDNPSYKIGDGPAYHFHPSTILFGGTTVNENNSRWQFLEDGLWHQRALILYKNGEEADFAELTVVPRAAELGTEEVPFEDIFDISNPTPYTIYGVLDENDEVTLWLYIKGEFQEVELSSDGSIMNVSQNLDFYKERSGRYSLAEWEFSLDDSALPAEVKEVKWHEVNTGVTPHYVEIQNSNGVTYRIKSWIYNLQDTHINVVDGYRQTSDVKKPKYNVVYGFEGTPKKYKIYYIDGLWYDVDFIQGSNNTLILAKVPVYGMVNYRGTLVSTSYKNNG